MAPGAARKQLFGPVLSQLRGLMIARMAKPEVSQTVSIKTLEYRLLPRVSQLTVLHCQARLAS